MSENLNWIDQLRKSFNAFEPEVTGDWKRMEGQLDALGHSDGGDMARKMKNAQRIAVGATAIAAGMAFWVLVPTITESTEEANALGVLVLLPLNQLSENPLLPRNPPSKKQARSQQTKAREHRTHLSSICQV